MRRTTVRRAPASALALVGVLGLAGCGSVRAGTDAGTAPGSAVSSPSVSGSRVSEQRSVGAELREAEDAACATWTPSATPSRSADTVPGESAVGGDRPPNYADNNAYRRALPLTGVAVCRGQAHVDRLTEGLRDTAVDRVEVDTALARLGYGDREVEQLATHGEGVRFTLGLGGVCVEGTLLPGHDSAIEAHGPYLEGGCAEPAYGH